MSGDEQALLKAIVAAPDDDVPRLVYADWLEENGRPERAAVIRLECAWYQALTDPDHFAARIRICNELQDCAWAHGSKCRGELPDLSGGVEWGESIRGFVETVRLSYLWHSGNTLAEQLALVPVRHLIYECGRAGTLEALLADPILDRLQSLTLAAFDDEAFSRNIELLIQHKFSVRLDRLRIDPHFPAEAVALLAQIPTDRSYPILDLRPITDLSSTQRNLLQSRFGERVLLP